MVKKNYANTNQNKAILILDKLDIKAWSITRDNEVYSITTQN